MQVDGECPVGSLRFGGRGFGGQQVFGADGIEGGEFGQGGHGHRPVGAFVGAQDHR